MTINFAGDLLLTLYSKVHYDPDMKAVLSLLLFALSACSRHNNLLLGRVEAAVGSHTVVVTDCYRFQVPEPRQVKPAEWQYTPCRDADIRITGEELIVNGRSYGRLKPADTVMVDHGVASVRRN